MQDKSLIELIDNYIKEKNFSLPVFDKISIRLQEIIKRDDYEIAEIEKAIQSDPTLSSEVLKAANSPYFKGLSEILSIKNAIIRLGSGQVADLALMASQKNNYKAKNKFIQYLMNKSWQGAVACAMTSRWISGKISYEEDSEAFMAGLLHDIGYLFLLTVIDKLIIAGEVPEDFSKELVMELILSMHAQKGYELLKNWNLPEMYCVIARDHHKYEFEASNIILSIVRLADKACIKLGLSIEYEDSIVLTETPEAEELGLTPIMLAEMEIMMEDSFRGVKAD